MLTMKRLPGLTFALVAAAVATVAHADGPNDGPKTRDDVRAETLAAVRDGTMVAPSGFTDREIYPGHYAAAMPAAPGESRDEVKSELKAAIRSGDVLATGRADLLMREEHPGLYPAQPVALGRSREEVKAELAEAIRRGDTMATGELDLTMREEFPQRYGAR